MAVTTTPLGFQKPDGNESVRNGDNVISANAQKMEELIQADRGRLGAIETVNAAQGNRLTAAESGLTSATSRVGAVESGNVTRDSRITSAESASTAQGARLGAVEGKVTTAQADLAGMSTHETRIGSFESQIAGLSAQVNAVSTPFNIGIDLDGVPYYSDGASGLSLEADTDGVPYFL